MDKITSYKYTAEYDLPIEIVWNFLVDSSRIDEIIGLPPYVPIEIVEEDNSVIRLCQRKYRGLMFKWQERFGEWTYLSESRMLRDFEWPADFSCIVESRIVKYGIRCKTEIILIWTLKSFFSKMLYYLKFYKILSDTLNTAIEKFIISKDKHSPIQAKWIPPTYSKKILQRVEQLINIIDASEYGHTLGRKIAKYTLYSLLDDVRQMRPLALAREWNIPATEVIEAFLKSVNCGLLGMRWNLLCPLCRISKSNTIGLHELPKGAHCSSCDINFDLNFSQNVELVFFPAPWLRVIKEDSACMLNPLMTPHIIAQWRLSPGEIRKIKFLSNLQNYRFRILETHQTLEVKMNPEQKLPFVHLANNGLQLLPDLNEEIIIVNDTLFHRHFIVEQTDYHEDVLTGQKLLTLTVFRELFPEQLLKPGDEVGITNLNILFTDLKNSTAFYSEVGDSSAYQIVREHFGFLSSIIYKNNGTIVKTIGDSVMVVFNDPLDAVYVCIEILNNIKKFNIENHSNLKIKIGIHQGNCISVNLNNVMDYFGTTVNLAARLHGLSDGDDFVVSETFFENVMVNEILQKYHGTKEVTNVKGIDHPVTYYRIKIPMP